jgi:hypothetical protein
MTITSSLVSITEENRESLSDLLNGDDWVLMLGSAISIWAPSSIPTGQEIRSSIYETLNFGQL